VYDSRFFGLTNSNSKRTKNSRIESPHAGVAHTRTLRNFPRHNYKIPVPRYDGVGGGGDGGHVTIYIIYI